MNIQLQEKIEKRKQLEIEFRKWLEHLTESGFQPYKVDCSECGGSGETICDHCGEGTVDCDICGGDGVDEFPSLDDYICFKKAEEMLMQLWRTASPLKVVDRQLPREIESLFSFIHQEDEEEDVKFPTAKIVIGVPS